MRKEERTAATLPVLNLPTQPAGADDVPLKKLLARDHRDLIARGCGEGGRNNAGYKLAADLLGADAWAKDEGIRTNGNPKTLFLEFCASAAHP